MQEKKNLKSKQEYLDLYDRLAVKDCRRREKFHLDYAESYGEPDSLKRGVAKMGSGVALYLDLLHSTLHWWEDKDKTIQEWIERDTRRDEIFDQAKAPSNIRCLKCQSITHPNFKDLHDWGKDNRIRVLFMYDCPNECLPRRAFFDDGEEYRPKVRTCPKCRGMIESNDQRTGQKIITTNSCGQCGYVDQEEMDLIPKPEIPDPDFLKDRERFCLTDEQAKEKIDERWRAENMGRLVERWKDEEGKKDARDQIAQIKKLMIVELEKLLAPALKKDKYLKFQLGTPELGRDLFLPFTVYDSSSDRKDMVSTHYLQKIIKKTLAGTNWRLMSDGISYRLGILTGRFRAYEREEDLLGLVKGD